MTKAVALFSGGLDSILACRVVAGLGIEVLAVKFVSPFFDYGLLADEKGYAAAIKDKYGINVRLVDISDKYLTMLRNPEHGYGKNFNPCVDCKILLAGETGKIMAEQGASFIISGEVIGQRPMSQRRDTLRIIERDSGCRGLLLRPLCAKNLEPTIAEEQGLIDREKLLDFSGRGRQDQMQLAQHLGITDYPAPAGGCALTDPIRGRRFEKFFRLHETITVNDALLLQQGRHFLLPGGGWLIIGRNLLENEKLSGLLQQGDYLLQIENWPGPTGILRYSDNETDPGQAAGIILHYSKKGEGRKNANVLVRKIIREGNDMEKADSGSGSTVAIDSLSLEQIREMGF